MLPVALGLAGLKTAFGAFQASKGSRMAKNLVRPEMEIPQSALDSLELARAQAGQNLLPGQGFMQAQMDTNAARGLAAARESASNPAQLLQAAMNINNQSSDNLLSMAIAGAERKDRNIGRLQDNLNTMANWEQLQWQTNKFDPYREKAALASSLQGAGIQNMFAGLDSAGATLMGKDQMDNMAKMLKELQEGQMDSMAKMLKKLQEGTGQEGTGEPE